MSDAKENCAKSWRREARAFCAAIFFCRGLVTVMHARRTKRKGTIRSLAPGSRSQRFLLRAVSAEYQRNSIWSDPYGSYLRFFVERLDGWLVSFLETSIFDKKGMVHQFRNETMDPTLMVIITLQDQPSFYLSGSLALRLEKIKFLSQGTVRSTTFTRL